MLRAGTILLDGRLRIVAIHVTGSCTVSEFVDGVEHRRWYFPFLVRTGLVGVRMTARAVWLILRRWPVDNLVIALMARRGGASDNQPMIQRLVRQAEVAIVGWCPRDGGVTLVAFYCSAKVPRTLADGGGAVMAG